MASQVGCGSQYLAKGHALLSALLVSVRRVLLCVGEARPVLATPSADVSDLQESLTNGNTLQAGYLLQQP